MIYGYARVSTRDQDLSSQIDDLKQAGAEKIYKEKFTGTTVNRPQFEKVLKTLKKGDTLVVTKLDRFARNTEEALHTVKLLFKKGVKINVLNIGQIDNTPTGKLIFSVFASFADFERDLIVARTQEGKAYAKAHDPNFKDGRPKEFSKAQLELAWELKQQGETYKMIKDKTGISTTTQWRYYKKQKNNS